MTQRRGNKPTKPPQPYKPIPVVTEQFRGKNKVDANVKRLRLIERLKNLGGMLRRLFGRKKKRRIETRTIKSKWISKKSSQWEVDRSIHKAKKKARNRHKRKQARALHQMERRRS